MDFVTRKLRHFRGIFIAEEKLTQKREISKLDNYLEFFYKILSWQDAALTLGTFLVLNFLFWLVIQLQLRFFGVICLLTLTAFITDSYLENWEFFKLEEQYLEHYDALKNDVMDVILSLKALRKDNPSSFCIGMSFIFLAISFIARNMSGYVIFYLFLLGLFFIPLGVSKLPPQYINSVKQFIRNLASERGVLAEDELIPFISGKDFNQRDMDLESLLTDKTADSVTSSLISGLSSMPSHMDVEDKESLDEDDLLPNKTPGDLSSESDEFDNKGITFESGHFNGDTSSSDDDLNFATTGEDNLLMTRDVVDTVSGNLMQTVTNVVKLVVGNPPPVRKDSSSDSDFEIINSDEVD